MIFTKMKGLLLAAASLMVFTSAQAQFEGSVSQYPTSGYEADVVSFNILGYHLRNHFHIILQVCIYADHDVAMWACCEQTRHQGILMSAVGCQFHAAYIGRGSMELADQFPGAVT